MEAVRLPPASPAAGELGRISATGVNRMIPMDPFIRGLITETIVIHSGSDLIDLKVVAVRKLGKRSCGQRLVPERDRCQVVPEREIFGLFRA